MPEHLHTDFYSTSATHYLENLKMGDHACCLYTSDEEHRQMVVSIFQAGLKHHDRIIYNEDLETSGKISEFLGDLAIDLNALIESGQIQLLSLDETCFGHGVFKSDEYFAKLKSEAAKTLAEGYRALRLAGDMTWMLRDKGGAGWLVEYEAKFDEIFPHDACIASCHYDMRRFPPSVILDILRTHPVCVIGGKAYRNFYYIPACERLSENRDAVELKNWIGNLQNFNGQTETLRKNNALYRAGFEKFPAVKILIDPASGDIVDANSAAARFYGYSVEKLKTMKIFDIDTMPKTQVAEELLQAQARQVQHLIIRHRLAFGEVRDVEVYSGPIEVDGQILLHTIIHDITERMLAEKSLRQSEARYRGIFETTFEGIYQSTLEGKFLSVNPAFAEMLGYSSPREIIESITDIGTQVYVNSADRKEIIKRIVSGETVKEFETRLYKKDKSIIWVLINTGVIKNAQGEIEYCHGGIVDISNRKKMEDDLRESEYRFRLIAENVNDAFSIFDMYNKTYIYVNKVFWKITGIPMTPFNEIYNNVIEIVHPDDRQIVAENFNYKELCDFEFRVQRPDGCIRWIHRRCFPVKDDAGRWTFIVAVGTDITEKKNAEAAAEKHRQELIQADKMASLGRIVSGVAHEINNPNNFIMLNAPLLRKAWKSALPVFKSNETIFSQAYIGKMRLDKFSESVSPLIEGIIEGSNRISRIVADLKDYARPDSGDVKGTIDFRQVVNSSHNLMRNTLTKKNVTLDLSIGEAPVMIQGNFQRLEQIVINLLQNALDALSPNGARFISLELDNGHEMEVQLRVRDTGCGIEPENLPHIIEPFFTTKRGCGGTGLGLSVSNKIVADHGGRLQFESEVGKGTTAYLRLPRKHG
jgi:PAS domain S-box-containing protein